MFYIETQKTLIFNVGINLFSCIIAAILYAGCRKDFSDTYENRLLRKIMAAVMLILLSDCAMWLLDGRPGLLVRILDYANIVFYFLVQIAIVLNWFRYAWYRIFHQKSLSKKMELLVFSPLVLCTLVTLSAPVNGWCFYLDGDNHYHRGILSVALSVVALSYLAAASILALLQHRHRNGTLLERRTELHTIAVFAIPPLLGGILQAVLYGLSLVWPCAVISCLLVLRNKESQAISQDPLTGLNNRRCMEKFLAQFSADQTRPTVVILLDINDLKHINDQYGHNSGDRALTQAADLLRTVFKGSPAFLSRFAGDEFVVILPDLQTSQAQLTVEKIKQCFGQFNRLHRFPFQLSVSAGYAAYTGQGQFCAAKLLKEADQSMYLDKQRYHRKAG